MGNDRKYLRFDDFDVDFWTAFSKIYEEKHPILLPNLEEIDRNFAEMPTLRGLVRLFSMEKLLSEECKNCEKREK